MKKRFGPIILYLWYDSDTNKRYEHNYVTGIAINIKDKYFYIGINYYN